jgi:hypothetical protein
MASFVVEQLWRILCLMLLMICGSLILHKPTHYKGKLLYSGTSTSSRIHCCVMFTFHLIPPYGLLLKMKLYFLTLFKSVPLAARVESTVHALFGILCRSLP